MFSFNWFSGMFGNLFSDFEEDGYAFSNCSDINPATGFLVCDGIDSGGNPYGFDLSDDNSSLIDSDDLHGCTNDFLEDSPFADTFDTM